MKLAWAFFEAQTVYETITGPGIQSEKRWNWRDACLNKKKKKKKKVRASVKHSCEWGLNWGREVSS